MSSSSTSSASASTTASASASATGVPILPSSFKVVGVLLAIISGALIGSSFVFKKKGLLRSQAGHEPGKGVAYLTSFMWWTGMIMMIVGEICNFVAYAFVPAIVVTPLGALSVVICAILSSVFLKESLTFFGWVGCGLCIVGSVIIAINGPQEATVGHIADFQKLFLAPGFASFGSTLIAVSLVFIFYLIPKYGKNNMLWSIMVCSMIGGLSVNATTGLGASIVTTIFLHDNQFKGVFIYLLMVFMVITLLTEVYYLNMALAIFNTAMGVSVTPTYYVIFTGFTLVTSVVLYQGLKATPAQILTVVMGFFVICAGITILQMSKVDPTHLNKLDRRSTILLQASRKNTEAAEKSISGMEDPGVDALRGSFGTVGSIIRARSARRMSQSSRTDSARSRHGFPGGTPHAKSIGRAPSHLARHQLYDAPMPARDDGGGGGGAEVSVLSGPTPRTPTIKFGEQDVAHYYHGPGEPAGATHQTFARAAAGTHVPRQPSPSPLSVSVDLERGPVTAPVGGRGFAASGLDAFESPATATGAGFPGVSYAYDEQRGHQRYQSSAGRGYPRTAGSDDRDESVSLVQEPRSEEGDSDSEAEGPPQGGIRLLSAGRI